jgi:hypothetical protein
VALQAGTLVTALWTSSTPTRRVAEAMVFAILAVLLAAGTFGAGEEAGRAIVGVTSLALVAITPLAMIRSLRELGAVTLHAITAALCVYLLLGMFFAALYSVVGTLSDDGFFAQGVDATYSDYLYYSSITQTTVGFGDLTAGTGAGRAFTSVQALLGQIYLVTVVATIVGRVGATRIPPDARPGSRRT